MVIFKKKMSKKTKLVVALVAFLVAWAIMVFILSKYGEMKTSEQKQIIFWKKAYKFPEPKDWNTDKLTNGQRLFYEQLSNK